MNVVEISHLTKLYKNDRGIRDLSFSIKKGQVFGLLGPNGSGKTTTMKIMTGLIRPDSGNAEIFGYNPGEDMEQAMQRVGCIIETPAFIPTLRQGRTLKLLESCIQTVRRRLLDTGWNSLAYPITKMKKQKNTLWE